MSDKPAPEEEISELDRRDLEVEEILKRLDAMRESHNHELTSAGFSPEMMATRARMSGLTQVMSDMALGTDRDTPMEPEAPAKKKRARIKL